MMAFEQLGHCFVKEKNYKMALRCFVKQLKYSWCLVSGCSFELRAYDNIGIVYYYLNQMEKAVYYHNRYLKGYYESDESLLKITYRTKRNEINKLKDNIEMNSCSPSTFKLNMGILFSVEQNEEVSFYNGTPLSNVSKESLPSPKQNTDDDNITIFPKFTLSKYKALDKLLGLKTNIITTASSKYKREVFLLKKKMGIINTNETRQTGFMTTREQLDMRLSTQFAEHLKLPSPRENSNILDTNIEASRNHAAIQYRHLISKERKKIVYK